MLLTKNQVVLRGIKIAMKRMRYMDWDASADYLYAKMGEALLGGLVTRGWAPATELAVVEAVFCMLYRATGRVPVSSSDG